MRSSRCVFSSATALHRVFVAPIELQSKLQVQVRELAFAGTTTPLRSQTPAQCSLTPVQRRNVSLHVAEKARLPRDDEITSSSVTLVDSEGKLTYPRSTSRVLSSIDRKLESLVIVVPASPGVPPICKILNKQQMRESEKAKAKAARGVGITQKTMELNWAIGKNDLGHRMGKLAGWLGKGWRVEVVLAGKKKGRKATEEEGHELVGAIRKVLEEQGGREMKPEEGKMLGTLALYLEGKQPNKGKKSEGKPVVGGEEKEVACGTSESVDVDAGEEITGSLKSEEERHSEASTTVGP